MIQLNNITRVYGKGDAAVAALRNLSLEIPEKSFVGILGPSGSGKSTLLNILGLIDEPSSGAYLLDVQDISSISHHAACKLRADKFGYITQNFALISELTVIESVMLPLRYSTNRIPNKRAIAEKMLERVGLAEKKNAFPTQLSGGQQQRVAIARALVNHPKVILADEPTGALDSATGQDVMKLLSKLHDEGQTIIMVTHDERLLPYFTHMVRMQDGRIVESSLQSLVQ
jgi:putative ABC transport system ATP-binding protein